MGSLSEAGGEFSRLTASQTCRLTPLARIPAPPPANGRPIFQEFVSELAAAAGLPNSAWVIWTSGFRLSSDELPVGVDQMLATPQHEG